MLLLRFLLPMLLVSLSSIASAQRLTSVAAARAQSVELISVPSQPTPDGTWITVLDQFVTASLGAALIGSALWVAVDDPEGSDRRTAGDFGYSPNANTAYVLGAYLGATIGVVWAGRDHNHDGTWVGSVLGGAIVAVPLAIAARQTTLFLPWSEFVWVPLQAIASTVGFQLSRRTR